MINKETLLNREQIIREVSLVGNGAHVFAPKEWVGEKVVVIRTPKSSLKRRILQVVEPYLENILGVYIYGSHARNEERDDSDIDLLIISNKRFKIKEKRFEIIVLEKDEIKNSIKIAPVLIYSALFEAKPIINSELLIELKKNYKPKPKDFKDYIRETKNIIKINEELLSAYSIILRLRSIYIIENLLSEKKYSFVKFKEWVLKDIKNESAKSNFDKVYNAYIREKNNLEANIKKDYLKDFLLTLKKKTQKIEAKINDQKEKKA